MSIGKAVCFSAELNFYPDTFPHAHPPTRYDLYIFLILHLFQQPLCFVNEIRQQFLEE